LSFPDIKLNEKINKKNMMLRGCKLKNTEWAIGIIVYTGKDTAIMMNGCEPKTKTSAIEQKVNNVILIIFAFEVLCSLGSAIYGYFSCKNNYKFVTMLVGDPVNCAQQLGIAFSAYFILFSTFIPISLIVCLEFVKIFQGYFMSTDK
jgi:magnesium-transporting ATPase (P-type)